MGASGTAGLSKPPHERFVLQKEAPRRLRASVFRLGYVYVSGLRLYQMAGGRSLVALFTLCPLAALQIAV